MSHRCERCGDTFPSRYYMAAARPAICRTCVARLSDVEKEELGVGPAAPGAVEAAAEPAADAQGLYAASVGVNAVIEVLAGSLVLAALWGGAFLLEVLDLRNSRSPDAGAKDTKNRCS